MADERVHAARRRTTVSMEVRLHLRAGIVSGRLLPGQALSENEVAASLGLSRTPVREALIKLEEEGLVAIYPQYGSFVAPIRVADILDGQFVRESLECAALAELVPVLSGEDERRLDALIAEQAGLLDGEPEPFFEADEAFHRLLMGLAGHARAWTVVEAAKGQHDRVRRLSVLDPLKRQAVLAEHEAVVRALHARDAASALSAMRRHLRGVFRSVEAAMARHPEFFATSEEVAVQVPPRPPRRRRGAA